MQVMTGGTGFHRTFKVMEEKRMTGRDVSQLNHLAAQNTSTQHYWQVAGYGTSPSRLEFSGSSFWEKSTKAERALAVPLHCTSVCHLPD